MDIDIAPKPPKYIDVDYMTLPNIDNNPLFYDEDAQEILDYWTDGKMVYWGFDPVSKDVEHFVWFNRRFAKDSKHCFLQCKKLRNVDHASFTALNNCYAGPCPMGHSAPSECGFPTDMPRTARPCTMKTLPARSRY